MSASDDLDPDQFTTGPDRYINFAEVFLGVHVTETQKEILRAVATNRRVLVQAGNGVGKSFIAAILNLAFLFTNPDSTNMATSGSYSVLSDVLWKPMRSMFKDAQEKMDLPGRTLENPPRLIVDDEWYWKAVSPTHPDNLEGRHAGTMLVTMEECDKPDIQEAHFDSAGSMITDASDRFLAIANPPKDEANIVYEKKTSDRWTDLKFSSFDSHNVRVDAGEIDDPKIQGLVELSTVAEDWEEWNDEPWPSITDAWETNYDGEYPGVSELIDKAEDSDSEFTNEELIDLLRPGYYTAKNSDTRDDLDERWYRRRLGIIPPESSQTHRPIYAQHVESSETRYNQLTSQERQSVTSIRRGIGVDIGHEGGDLTVVAQLRGNYLEIWEEKQYQKPWENEQLISDAIDAGAITGNCAIDAIGEGSGPAAAADRDYDCAFRFKANSNPIQETEYYDKKTEAYNMLGDFVRDGGIVADQSLRKEMYAAARTMEYDERKSGEDTVLVTSKNPVKDRLGTSPDRLDAAAMAVWAANVENPETLDEKQSGVYQTPAW